MFEILTSGQKLKRLRKELHLTQAQLASGTISREFISMVEHGIREMSPQIAQTLYETMTLEAENRGLIFPYDKEYLQRNIHQETIYLCKHLSSTWTSEDLISLKENILIIKNLEAVMLIDYEIGKRYLEEGNLTDALVFTRNAYETSLQFKNNDILLRTSNNLGYIKSSLNEIQDAIAYFNKAFNLSEDINLKSSIEYNIVMTLYQNGDYLAVEEELSRIDSQGFKFTEEYNNHILNVKGLIHLQKNNLVEAKKIFNKILSETKEPEILAIALSNLSEVELQSKNFELAKKLNEESAALRTYNPKMLEENILNSAHILYDCNEIYEASKILENYIENNKSPRLGNAYRLLLEIYESQNNLQDYLRVFKSGLLFFSTSNQVEKLLIYLAKGSKYLGEQIPEEYYSAIRPFLNKYAE